MFAEDIGMHAVYIDSTFLAEKMSEASAVEYGAGSDHPPPVVPGTLHGNMSQNINGIAHDEYHSGALLAKNVIDYAANDGCVLL